MHNHAPGTLKRLMRWIMVHPRTKCWVYTGGLSSGYGTFQPRLGTQKFDGAHRVSWELHNDAIIPKSMDICHHCDNRYCFNPEHLFLGTRKDNLQDMARKGRSSRGEKHGVSKLTEKDVVEIRKNISNQRTTALKYGVTQTLISQVRSRKIWKHIA